MQAIDPVAVSRARPWYRTYFHALTIPFWGVHVAALVGIILVGWSWTGLALAAALYVPRVFFTTGFYHRYFSHRTYKTSRWFQFVMAVCAESTMEKGVLWWASHHRNHHKVSDEPGDFHSPRYGFWWSHIGWIVTRDFEGTDLDRVKDLAKYPELRWLDKWHLVPPITFAALMLLIAGPWGLVYGFFLCQVFTWHGTFTINSLSHLFGTRRYQTSDDSRNNWMLAILTLGEGWHNNHHHYQVAARNGFRWYEIDVTYYVLRTFAAVGLVWDLHGVPDHVLKDERPEPEAAEPERLVA